MGMIDTTCPKCGVRDISVRPVFHTRILQFPTHEHRESTNYRGLEVMCQHCRHTVTHELPRGMDPALMLEVMKQMVDENEP